MSINTEFEFEQVKIKFNQLIRFGKDFGNDLIVGNKNKKKTIFASLRTPYDYSDDAEAKERKSEKPDALKNTMKGFVKQIFQHYDVNPSINGYNERIVNTYVNDNLDTITYFRKAIPKVVNRDDNLYNDIITLIEKIKNNKDIHQEERKIYITGLRGAGKTSYINYFISKYEEELNKKNIISIRINVLRIDPDNLSEDALEQAIKFKICRILFTYYCTWQQKGDDRLSDRKIKDKINKYLSIIKSSSDNDYCENKIKECSDYFKGQNSKEPQPIPPQYEQLCNLLLSLVIKDYKFIIMLDNFDQITPTPNEKKIYENRMKGLHNINKSYFFNHSIYIIALRYNTFNALPNHTRKHSSCCVVGTPKTFDMLNKRIDYFTSISESQLKEKKINCFKNLIILIGNNFMPDNANSTKKPINFQEACSLFDDIFYGNKRMIINMVDRFIDIIPNNEFDLLCEVDYDKIIDNIFDKLISQTYYKIFESLLIDTSTGYCNCFFEYKKENDKYQFSAINSTAHFDENFIPNIYRFPAIPNREGVQFIPFLKIRILQLLKNHKNENDKLNQIDIAQKLNNIFDYRKDVIYLACEELRWDQSIIIIEKEPENDEEHQEELKEKSLDITPRGENLLKILPTNINLLAVATEQAFLPVSFLKTGMPIGNYNDDNISNFIIRNIFFSLPKTIGLLHSIEQYEKNRVLPRTTKDNQKCFINSDFAITEKLEDIANNSIKKIYDTYFSSYDENDTRFNRRRTELKNQLGIEV